MPRKRAPITTAAALTLLLGALGTTGARADTQPVTDLYVAQVQSCVDSGPGSQAEPFCTVQDAADVVEPGQTVHIAGAVTPGYDGFTLTRSGTEAAPISFVSDATTPSLTISGPITISGAHDVSFSGINTTVGSVESGKSALTISGSQRIVFDRARLNTYTADPAAVASVDGTSSDVTLSRLRITRGAGWGVDIQSGAHSIVVTGDVIGSLGTVAPALGGLHADSVAGITVTGDTVNARCGSAVSITGTSSGSIENVVAVSAGYVNLPYCSNPSFSASTEIEVSADSAPQVSSDYNDVYATNYGIDYDWAGKTYATSADLYADTGQGRHDISSTTGLSTATGALVYEASPVIDSGDADAPGELATDVDGRAHVDDPLVPDTGNGVVDRGAVEFSNPIAVRNWTIPKVTAAVPASITANLNNPWSTPVTYRYDFGDGVSTTSTSPTVTHTYAQPSVYPVTVRVLAADGVTVLSSTVYNLTVNPAPALAPSISTGSSDPQTPDVAQVAFGSSSVYGISDNLVDFGDGSTAQHFAGSTTGTTHAYAHPGTYTVTDQVTDQGNRTATATQRVVVGAAYVPLDPSVRFLNTATGVGAAKKKVGAGGKIRLKIAGVHGIPSSGVTAVTMNITDTGATASSYVSAYPDGSPLPKVSDLNFGAGQTNPNEVTVAVGSDGYVDLYNHVGSVNLLADVQGYYTTRAGASPQQSGLVSGFATRVLSTVAGTGAAKGAIGPGGRVTFHAALPAGSEPASSPVAVVLNVTATAGTASSYVAVDTAGATSAPTTSVLNFTAGQTTSNLVVVPVGPDGEVTLYNHSGHVQLLADIQGVYTTGDGAEPFVPVTPVRILDTRYGPGVAAGTVIGPNGDATAAVPTGYAVPTGADVLVNITGTGATATTYLTAWQNPGLVPGTSNLNLKPGQTRPVLALAPVSGGYIAIRNHSGKVSIIADLAGYFG